MLSHGAECDMWNIFRVSHIMQLLTAKYEKREKYLRILHEATCDNYFIVNACLNQINQELSYLLTAESLVNMI